VVFLPFDGRTSHYVLRLGDPRNLGGRHFGVDVSRVLTRSRTWLRTGVGVVTGHGIGEARKSGRQYIVVRGDCLGSLRLQRTSKGRWVRYGDGLELLQGLEIALALLALQLQQGNGGAQGDCIRVVTLGDGHGRRG